MSVIDTARRAAGAFALAAVVVSSAHAAIPSKPVRLFATPEGYSDQDFRVVGTGEGFLLAWTRVLAADGSAAVVAQRFDGAGKAIGQTITVDPAANPAAKPAMLPVDGGRVVFAWTHAQIVQAAFVELASGAVSAPIDVAQNGHVSFAHSVAPLGSGRYVLISRFGVPRSDKENTILTILDSGLHPIGKPSTIERDTADLIDKDTYWPSEQQTITAFGKGAVAVYHGADNAIHGVPVDRKGKPGVAFPISTTPGNAFHVLELYAYRIQALGLAGGGYVVVWYHREQAGDPGFLQYDLRARVFGKDGVPIGDDFTVNARRNETQIATSLMPAGDGFAVTFLSSSINGGPVTSLIRTFDSRGKPLTGDVTTEKFADTDDDPAPDLAIVGAPLPYGSYVEIYGVRGAIYADGIPAR